MTPQSPSERNQIPMNALPIVKLVAEGIASIGVGHVVSNAIKATTPEDLTRYQRVAVGVGSVVIGGIASKAASNYASGTITEIVDFFKKPNDESPKDSDTAEDN